MRVLAWSIFFALNVVSVVHGQSNPVLVELYYESLCPYCQEFFLNQLNGTQNILQDSGIMEVRIYPYGNAQQEQLPDGSWNFTCQHGHRECLGNIAEACILDEAQYDPALFMNVIACMEASNDPADATEACVKQWSKLDYDQINTCREGPKGIKLHHEMGLKTESLDPEHNFVPWIVVDGKHSNDIQNQAQDNLLKFVCESFGGEKPSECQEVKSVWDRMLALYQRIKIDIL
ncbi:hypothetical protein TCAL_08269 [Tigriopus californicus]|uniref:Gamma-interferon-inducible lysosomal thiol reductase n=1 Tax=Tigriopus californicus TaxID=6832 RepID=A0A553N935_TIGCA|nr:gamma-interferon-inducible lysosomal thiol reductase-like isoform X2 [Tigriopus californicus]TRY61958.1 hypothetical protein TCAL_08269 [Tigriopus californicus]|eukprot:TCALIF_08269-PA protein Name:"Similar to IFI30 Gamma-interferon-inducible lysosomal thiol reductase (Bos taurus)" AED:0.17 eAED:0.17 QI:0/0.5/0.33/0.66/1/1/3/133/231